MNTRERKQRKAERLQGWAQQRQAKAAAGFAKADPYRGDTAFWTQPGRVIERERVFTAGERAYHDTVKANAMASRAAGIEDQLDRSIYSDDVDAIERLEERIATLETQRDMFKAYNASCRKGAPDYDLLDEIGRKAVMSCATAGQLHDNRSVPSYLLTNIGADIRRNKQRLDALRASASETTPRPLRVIQARRAGSCERCGDAIEVGAYIGKYADGWSHVSDTPWARCEES